MTNNSLNLAFWDSRSTGNTINLDFSIFTSKMVFFCSFLYGVVPVIKIKELVGHGDLRIDPMKLLTSKNFGRTTPGAA